ncbi:methyltransferase [Photobacterium sp. WH24]|uniref:class I SAM-dependent methyltransferase n=1 Tax=Photobacterium sp. WH24 TaxID=2827237 RepID=UPI001C49282F|nr:class I SAM-dependent methyltransferase [Photobacterium sp. WH24]MBV7262799.1 methyltransferase [Photobacterium sp. WH24]
MMTSLCGTPEQHALFSSLLGPVRWQVLEFAFSHHLFDHFEQHNSVDVVAQQHHWDPERLELLLNALVAMALMSKSDYGYKLNAPYCPYLLSHSAQYLGDTLTHLARVKSISPAGIHDSLQLPHQSATELNMRNTQFWQQATTGLQAFHRSVRNPILLPVLGTLQGWDTGLTILDFGAGSLQLAQDILNCSPQCEITIFDLPPCCEHLSQQLLAENKPASAIHFLPGDMNEAHFGGPYQLIIAAMSLYFAKDLNQCINQIWQALEPGGTFISFHESLNTARTQPAFHILGRLPAELVNGPLSLEAGQVEAALEANTPANLRSLPLQTPFGEMTLIIAEKSINT